MKKTRPHAPIRTLPPAGGAEAGSDRSRRLWALALWAAALLVYGLSHDRLYYFDGLLQAGMIEDSLKRIAPQIVFEWNHFLWYPTGRAFYLLLRFLHIDLRGYEALQLLNTLVGATGVSAVFLLLTRLIPRPWALIWTGLAAFSEVYWYRAGGAENHLAGGLWVILFCGPLLSYWEAPSYRSLSLMALSSTLAVYYHLGNFAVWGALGLAVLLKAGKKKWLGHATWSAILTGGLMAPYASVHGWFEPGGFQKWWVWATRLAHGLTENTSGGVMDLAFSRNVLLSLTTFLKSTFYYDTFSASLLIKLLAFFSMGVLACLRPGPAPETPSTRDSRVWALALPLGCFFVLYTFWSPGNYMYWIVQPVLAFSVVGVLAHRGRPEKPRPAQWALFAAMAALLAGHNATALILPHKKNPQQFIVDGATAMGALTPPESPIVISGIGWQSLKPYIPYFAKRNRLAFDLFAINAEAQGMEPVAWMKGTIAGAFSAGVPVYITDDAMTSQKGLAAYKFTPEQLASVWAPYTLLPVRDFPGEPPNRLYLMWDPRASKDAKDLIAIRLNMNKLHDQLLMVLKEEQRLYPSPEIAAEIARVEALIKH